MVKNILSIDFDIIMYPCIKLYNDQVPGDENPTVLWNNLEERFDIDHFLTYDARLYIEIVKCVKEAVANGAKLIQIEDHDKLVDWIKGFDDEFYNDEENKYNITNIDFHHDLMYRKLDKSAITRFDKYNCSDWLGYLYLKKKAQSITWVKAPNSIPYCNDFGEIKDLEILPKSEIGILNKTNKFDYVFLCLSPQWVPYKFKHLYDLIIELFKEEDD